ncbi:hypothetical protein K474DRAFT_1704711 [Panus rudis PR-1116 ss-1]|nr:hypothetical protein K474DRAFT_1704711 [Panus rudis PR-1116 ss-1]
MLDELGGFLVGQRAAASFDISSTPTNEKASIDFPFVFPETWQDWVELNETDQFDAPWESLRDFFSSSGYQLYVCPPRSRHTRLSCPPSAAEPMHLTEFGTIGRLTYVPEHEVMDNRLWAAQHRSGRHVIIRMHYVDPNAQSDTGLENEFIHIMEYLSQRQLRNETTANPLAPIDHLYHRCWRFMVFSRWQPVLMSTPSGQLRCPLPEMTDVLRFCEAVCNGFALLHSHRIAHLNISPTSIVMNVLSGTYLAQNWSDGVRFLHNDALRYAIQDFDNARQFDADAVGPCKVALYGDCRSMPPEARQRQPRPYDPFAADVYTLGTLFIAYFAHLVAYVPILGPTFEQMTRVNPHERISMREAAAMFQKAIQTKQYRPFASGYLSSVFLGTVTRPEEEDMDVVNDDSDLESDSEDED